MSLHVCPHSKQLSRGADTEEEERSAAAGNLEEEVWGLSAQYYCTEKVCTTCSLYYLKNKLSLYNHSKQEVKVIFPVGHLFLFRCGFPLLWGDFFHFLFCLGWREKEEFPNGTITIKKQNKNKLLVWVVLCQERADPRRNSSAEVHTGVVAYGSCTTLLCEGMCNCRCLLSTLWSGSEQL